MRLFCRPAAVKTKNGNRIEALMSIFKERTMSTVARLNKGRSLSRNLMAALMLLVAGVIYALGNNAFAAPLAGTTIGNQAAATYTDASSIPRTATSNTVNTVVQQVASFTLTAPQTRNSAPSAPVSFSHTITNTGNGPDTISLASANLGGDNFDLGGLSIFADANCDGTADNATPIASVGPLAAFTGATCVVLQGTVPAVLAGNQALVSITGTSVFNGTVTQSNTDTVNVTGNAVVNITGKTISAPSGNPGSGPYTYTITFTNTGAATAQNVIIGDIVPAGMTYAAGSGRWSVSGATALGDGAGGDPAGITYDFNVTTAGVVTATIATLAPNATQTVTFQVNVPVTTPPGVINNTARLCYTDNTTGGVQVPAGCTAANVTTTGQVSNTVPFTVNQLASVVANSRNNSTANAAGADNTVTVASAAQGATVSFDNYIWNLGNGADSFTIALSGSTFPVGTTFQLFQQDGVTPLVGSTTPSIPASNTGTCSPANAATNGFVQDGVARCGYRVVLRATLPGASTGGPFSVVKTATSVFNGAVSDPVTDTLTVITASAVDLRNGAANTLGTGAGPEGAPVTTNSANPGTTTTFTLKVNNTVGPADTFNLAASTDNSFATIVLPAGWTVTFRADGGVGDCSTTGAVITNTGVVNSASVVTVCAIVSVPVNAVASPSPGTSVFFRVLSPTTGVLDRKHDAVIVNTVRNVTFTANNTGQVFPGGSVVYTHTIANAGNVVEGATAGQIVLSQLMSGVTAGWAAGVFWDRNNDGTLDGGDPAITDLSALTGGTGGASTAAGLDPGESARIFVRVTAPAGANIGDTNVVTLTATITGAINGVAAPAAVAVTDTTQVIAGQVRLDKTQALDANCDGIADTAFSTANITTGAIPGACIRYQIVITNQGTAAVSGLVVSDATPANTTYHILVPAAVTGAGNTVTAPAGGATGTVQATIPTLAAGASQTLTFGVRIDP
jgi:trimeric autotransporter adhesin